MIKKILFTFLTSALFTGAFAQDGVVCVQVFSDQNGDGIQDLDEPGVGGLDITILNAPASFPFPLPYSIPTDSTGSCCFTSLNDGQYSFGIEVPTGWEINGNPFFVVDVTGGAPNNYRFGAKSTMSASQFGKSGSTVYPNPARDEITVLNGNIAIGEIMLYDSKGRSIMSQKLDLHQTKINTGSLEAGLYIARINSGERYETIRIIVTD